MANGIANRTRRFWWLSGFGFLLPWIVIIGCEIYFGQAAEIRHFPEHLFESGYNFFLVGVMNATPFVLLAGAAHYLLKSVSSPQSYRSRLAGLYTAAAGVLAVSLLAQVSVWGNIFNPKVHGSLAGLGLFVLFWGALAILVIGYLIGWAAAKMF